MVLGLWILRIGAAGVLRVERWGSHGKVSVGHLDNKVKMVTVAV